MTPPDAYKLISGFLSSARCTFQGLNEAVQISEAMKALEPNVREAMKAPDPTTRSKGAIPPDENPKSDGQSPPRAP